MSSRTSFRFGLAVCAVGLVCALVAGAGVWVLADSADRQPVGVNATGRYAALDGLAGTVELVVDTPRSTDRLVKRIRMRPGTGKIRTRVVAGPETKRGTTVSNGSTTWQYTPRRNRVQKYSRPVIVGPGNRSVGPRVRRIERIERLFERLNVTAAAGQPAEGTNVTVQLAPIPVQPRGSPVDGTSALPAARYSRFRVTFAGTADVAGRKTYVLRMRTTGEPENGPETYNRTLFVDTEHFVPLRDHVEAVVDGRRFEQTRAYRNVSFDPGIDDDRFQFDPPENATVETVDPVTEYRYTSRRALAADAETRLPNPDLPPSFAFERGARWSGSGLIRVEYANATARITVDVNPDSGIVERRDEEGRTVRIDGRQARYERYGPAQSVTWRCDDHRYALRAEGVSRETALAAAASVGCTA